jgi:hypothetical protein
MPVTAAVTARCPGCRTAATVPPGALLVDVDAVTDDAGCAAAVAWVCEGCRDLVGVPAGWAPLQALLSAGAVLLESCAADEPSAADQPSEADEPSAAGFA